VSLSGSIEDLPLLEILQVVAFCQRTGHLTVVTPEGDGAVVFRDGRVVAGYTWDTPPEGAIGGLDRAARERALRARLTDIIARLVRLREGRFAFSIAGTAPTELGGRNLASETLDDGINPEELMLELARTLDEERRGASAVIEASFAAATGTGEPAAEITVPEAPAPAQSRVLLVDDEADVLRVVGERLRTAGYAVTTAAEVGTAAREATRLAATGDPLVVVTDFGLPSASGATFRGGIDVAKHAAGLHPRPPVLLVSETIDDSLRARAGRLGVSCLAYKPGLSKLDPRQYEIDLRAFGDSLARTLLPKLLGRPSPVRSPAALPATQGAAAVRAALESLARHPDPDHVAFLVLDVARSFFSRGMLLIARDDALRGLAGFGPTADGGGLDRLARDILVPLDEPSAFSETVASGRPWSGPLPTEGAGRRLVDRIGALDATTSSLLPLRAHRETIAVLYGDTADGAGLPPLEPLVAFIEKASRTLESALGGRSGAAA
jgi:CheY-like chemotaxis protein